MGLLVEQALPSLFGGVSKQPAHTRHANQVEASDNALMAVVTGGFEKRPPTQHISALTFLDTTKTYAVHGIDRDATEQTFILVADDGVIAVNAITGAQVTVTTGDSTRFYLVEQADIDGTGVVQIDAANMSIQTQADSTETTFDWDFVSSDTNTVFKIEGSADNSVWNDIATGKTGTSGTFSTTVDAVATGDHNYLRVNITTGAGTAADTLTLKATFKDLTYLLGGDADDFRLVSVADNAFLTNRTVTTRMAAADSGTITGTKQEFSDLPANSGSGNVWRVTGTDLDSFGTYFVQDDATTSTWEETVDPTGHNTFDTSTLPHRLVRAADGSYTFAATAWAARQAGDETLTEAPKFIGKAVQDLTFYRNRLALVADEECYTSQAGNVLDLWPEKAVDVLDSDPVSRAATTTDVNILKFATVFRKILFATSARAQFELASEGAFTPEKATFDLATSYTASTIAKPVAMGDVLYFPSKTQRNAVMYEYFFDDATLSNTAADITKHIVDYIPNDTLQIAADPTTQTVFVLSTGEQNALFVYRTFFDGSEKLQSSWARYTYGAAEANAFIHGIAVMSGYLVMIIERDDGFIYLEQMPIEREAANAAVGYVPHLDQREVVTGTYSSTHDCTHWDLSYEHADDAQIILGASFSEAGRQPTAFYPDVYKLTLTTVLAAETLIINGVTFTAHATTTTTANREFSISGNDIADAGELTTVLNDATDGAAGVTATDNGDGTVTLHADDACDGTITAPTGTAITNATMTAVEVGDRVATRGDLSASSVWVGRDYTFTVTLSQQYYRDKDNTAILTGRLQLRDMTFNLVETGFLKVTVTPDARDALVYTFEGKVLGDGLTIGGSSVMDEATFKVPIWSKSSGVSIVLSNDQPTPCVVTSAAWRGFFNEISRQE